MNLEILLPFQCFARCDEVLRIVAEAEDGSFGILPHRLDCVVGLVPGLLLYETAQGGTVIVGIDEGVLLKRGAQVVVAVRRALPGTDLARLREAVEREFLTLDEHEQNVRAVVAKLEGGLISGLAELQRG